MEKEYVNVLFHLLLAMLAGAMIGLERTYHGRPAGFRTHTLVCTASSLLMQLTLFQWEMIATMPMETVRIDPTRMAQGIMTGIGFLGAGVVLKDGLTVRGLTTAASIWMTAAIGIMAGAGFYFATVVATLLTLGTLSVFRRIELIMPALYYSRLEIRFLRKETMTESDLRTLAADNGFSVANLSYALKEEGKFFEYSMVIRTNKPDDNRRLAGALAGNDKVLEFRITPAGD